MKKAGKSVSSFRTIFICSLFFLSICFLTPNADAQDSNPQVAGYASASSVRQGESINFHTSTLASEYDIQIFREGATGRELMQTITNLPGNFYNCQEAVGVPVEQDEESLGCNWPVAYTLNVPQSWASGMYVADLLDPDDQPGNWGSYIFFIVSENQPGSTSNILFHMPTNTWQAYNYYGGWSLYSDPAAVKISFDRPYSACLMNIYNCIFHFELPLLRWLESEGYVVEYVASEDIHNDPQLLLNYRLFLSVGHDEYWSKEMRDHLDAFLDAAGNCAIFSGNTMYRQVRYEDDGRTLVGYKSRWEHDPLYGVDNIRVSTAFHKYPVNWPQNSTTGLGWTGYVNWTPESSGKGRFTTYRSDHWIYEGTNLQDGEDFWYEPEEEAEVDGTAFVWVNGLPIATGEDNTPLNFVILGIQPSNRGHATMGIYAHSGGGAVFNGATWAWPSGLLPEYNPDDYQIIQKITRNVINTLSSSSPPPAPPPLPPIPSEEIIPLVSGQSVSGSVSIGDWVYYQIDAAASDSEIKVELSNLSADVDLYVREGSLPTIGAYDCRPYSGSTNSETCTLANAEAVTWYIGVYGYRSGSFRLKATLVEGGEEEIIPLVSGQSVSGSVSIGDWVYYQIDAAASDSEIKVELSNLSADVDLYVREASLPTTAVYDCRPYSGGTTLEICSLANAEAVTWYIGVYGYRSGSYSLKATLN